jgi:hypothetical protein
VLIHLPPIQPPPEPPPDPHLLLLHDPNIKLLSMLRHKPIQTNDSTLLTPALNLFRGLHSGRRATAARTSLTIKQTTSLLKPGSSWAWCGSVGISVFAHEACERVFRTLVSGFVFENLVHNVDSPRQYLGCRCAGVAPGAARTVADADAGWVGGREFLPAV